MKATCLKHYLQKAGLLSEKIPNRNPTLPILNAVLISANKNSLVFFNTNLEIALKISIPAKIEKEGKVALPSKLFCSLISSLPDHNEIKLDSIKDNLIITTKNSSTTIKGYLVEDFPLLPKIKEKNSFIVSVNDFISGLKSVYCSASLSEIKPEINSILLFSSVKTPLTFVATDSFRLSEKTIPYNFSNFPNILIPYRSAVEILRIFENQEGDIVIKTDDNNLILENDNIEFTTRLTDGNFIDYKQIIPVDFTNTAIVNKKEFNNCLKSSAIFRGKLNEVKLKIYKDENFLEVQTNNPDLGEHTVNIKTETEGDDLMMVFNHRYLIDCLSSVNSEKIILKFNGEGKPLLITSLDDKSFFCLIMPMKNI